MAEMPVNSQNQPPQGPVIPVPAKPDVYTVLLFVGILALGVAIGVVAWKLNTVYGMGFSEILSPAS